MHVFQLLSLKGQVHLSTSVDKCSTERGLILIWFLRESGLMGITAGLQYLAKMGFVFKQPGKKVLP